ncbi:glucose-6-phosphate dehydrogenase [Bacillus sp. B15-48]|uniref:glucose-6-phosphate dehydrogenase n=1 Tax=Bacillus sp. B15-48 TaxID=1548601 RepID=UPI00193F464D|nr:glucose-6-phosphate dehydrogenase [Bacillus sp. B15-48]MBM4764611.1 glucose-6-phosphate dehydrogenase [Bacillus sp. B15-48]
MESMTFVLFGATGDLAKRKIFPALYNLYLDHKIPNPISIIGLGRGEMSDNEFQNHVEQSLKNFSRRDDFDTKKIKPFLEYFRYSVLDATKLGDFKKLQNIVENREKELNIQENRMFYLSVGPEFFSPIANNIKESGLGTTKGWKRLIIEKPFGRDLQTARELNDNLSKAFKEEEIYRIDHYLGKSMIQSLESLAFANPVLQTLLNNKHIANVQITASETVGVEERAGYYDKSGAIRDMFQNHMMQILMMSAMHVPNNINPDEIRSEKRKVIESIRPLKKEDVQKDIIRAQYKAGKINGEPVISYINERGIMESSENDTFIAARLWIDNPFWQGVPFYIRTGKRMAKKSTRIVIEFKATSKKERKQNLNPNLLIIEINPNENVTLQINSRNPISGKIEPANISLFNEQINVPEAYERLLYDAFRGDATFFAHWKEVELSWKWVQPILEAFEENLVPLHYYLSGSNGPKASDSLLYEQGFKWWLDHEEQMDDDSYIVTKDLLAK